MKKKVLFLIQTPPPVHGSSLIGQRIKESELINNQFDCDFINTMTSRNMKELGKKPILKFFRFLGVYFSFIKQLLSRKYNLCFFAITSKGKALYRDILFIATLKLFRVPYILLMNNKGVSSASHKPINNRLYHFLFKKAQVIINSRFIYPDIEKYVPEDNLHILFNGIPDVFEKKLKTSKNRTVKLLYLGNMTRSKGAFIVLEACKILNERGILFECDFVGAWNDLTSDEFTKFVDTNDLNSKVNYLGPKYDNEKWEVLGQADIFVFPTYYHYECFPLVLLEAMQFGLPIISTPEGGIRDIIDDEKTGYLVQQKDQIALADQLEKLITNEKIRFEMGTAGRLKYEKYFTIKTFEENLNDILIKVS